MKNPCKKPTVCLDKFHAKPGKNVYFIYEFFTCVWCPIFHMYVWCPIWRWHRIKFRRAFASNVLYVCCIKRNERGFQNSEFPCRFIFFKMAGGLGIWVAVLGLPVKHGWQRRILLDANQDTRKHTGLKHTNHLLPLVVVWAVGWHYIVGENTQHKSPKNWMKKTRTNTIECGKFWTKENLGAPCTFASTRPTELIFGGGLHQPVKRGEKGIDCFVGSIFQIFVLWWGLRMDTKIFNVMQYNIL